MLVWSLATSNPAGKHVRVASRPACAGVCARNTSDLNGKQSNVQVFPQDGTHLRVEAQSKDAAGPGLPLLGRGWSVA